MYKILLIFSFLLAFTHPPVTRSVKKKAPPALFKDSIRLDTSKTSERSFNAAALDKYQNNPEFFYKDRSAGLNWWERFWAWFWEMIEKLFGGQPAKSSPSFPFMQFIFWGIIIALVVFAIIKLAGIRLKNIFNKNSKEIALPYSESLENIHLITFDEEIEKSLAQRNYRLAVRLLYLRTLKQLNDAGLIHWQIEKTNSAYLNELTDSGQRQSFSVLTRRFEYVWYGDFPVDAHSFQSINALFMDFKTMLK